MAVSEMLQVQSAHNIVVCFVLPQPFGSKSPPNVENWKLLSGGLLRGHRSDIADLAWSPDDTLLAVASFDNTVSLWSMPGERAWPVQNAPSYLLVGLGGSTHDADGLPAASCTTQSALSCSCTETRADRSLSSTATAHVAECMRVASLSGHAGMVKGVAWDPLGKFLATQGDREFIIWRCEDWQPVASNKELLKDSRESSFHAMCAAAASRRLTCALRCVV